MGVRHKREEGGTRVRSVFFKGAMPEGSEPKSENAAIPFFCNG